MILNKIQSKAVLRLYCCLAIMSILTCNSGDTHFYSKKNISLIGNIKNLPVNKIYLTDAAKWDILIDSATIFGDKFEFSIDSSKYSEPFLASVCFLNNESKIEQLAVFNYKRTNSKDTFSNTGFMLSLGKTELFGDYNDRYHRVSISPNPENDLLFDLQTEYFGASKNLRSINEIIKNNPSSYFLLQKLFQFKALYSANEIKDILLNFNAELLESKTASNLLKHADYLQLEGEAYPNALLKKTNGSSDSIFNNSSKLTMVVFWASWCGPCRLEIPQLKAIRKKYSLDDLCMKSVSIDDDSDKWLKAIEEEKMPWEQYLISGSDVTKMNAQFSISAIPIVIFVDKNRKKIKRFEGYSESKTGEYIKLIEDYLTKN